MALTPYYNYVQLISIIKILYQQEYMKSLTLKWYIRSFYSLYQQRP